MNHGRAAPPAVSRTHRGRSACRGPDERGAGLVSSWCGLVVFLTLLLVAVQILFNLYATSVVTTVSYDAARRVAASGTDSGATAEAEAHARQSLGRFGERVTFDWTASGSDQVVLRVHARSPGFTLPAVGVPSAFRDIDRTLRVRVERFR